jgi:hypothetical protein
MAVNERLPRTERAIDMALFHKRKEGDIFRPGFNYTKTSKEHSFGVMVWVPRVWRLNRLLWVGYYRDGSLHMHFDAWNQVEMKEKDDLCNGRA